MDHALRFERVLIVFHPQSLVRGEELLIGILAIAFESFEFDFTRFPDGSTRCRFLLLFCLLRFSHDRVDRAAVVMPQNGSR